MRPTTVILTQQDVARLADLRLALKVVRGAFQAMARGEVVMPAKLYLPLPRGGDFRAMPAFLERPRACGIKWVNVHPGNGRRGLPTVMAVIVLNDPDTGVPVAILDGLLITKLRTAASAALAAQALARPESRIVGLVGCGAQADAQVQALALVLGLERVKVWGYHAGEAERFCRRMRRIMPGLLVEPCVTVERCVRETDVVVTVTPSRRPLVRRAWLSPGTHVNAIGADAPGKQELEARILREAIVVVDDRAQALHSGELNVPVRRGRFDPRDIHATLGDVLIGRVRGRGSPRALTVFDATGVAAHDVALGHAIVQRARRRGLGRRIRLFRFRETDIRETDV